MKVSLVIAVLNEEKSVKNLLRSISRQTKKPSEIIFVDGGSSDNTLGEIKSSTKKLRIRNVKIFGKKGNRSVARNFAIKKSNSEVIASTDAGCILNKNWLERITEPFKGKKIDVVAGYYKGRAETIFQKCLIPYVLIMPDKVDQQNFLPATRSIAFRKSIWKKAKGFPEKYSHNEDYVFANHLQTIGARIVFKKDAIVEWLPRKNLWDSFVMFARFAFGDAEAGIFRTKVIFIFLRYFIGAYLILLSFIERVYLIDFFVFVACIFYIFWATVKNYRYVKQRDAIVILPSLQLVSDIAILLGTVVGFIKLLAGVCKKNLKNSFGIILLILLYALVMISMIQWGIPNLSHPFNYQMDEWHQLESVRNLFKYGSPNIAGSAHGTIFSFFLAGLYLSPFVLLNIVNPFLIKSSLDYLSIQQMLFILLRFNTLLYGVLSLGLIAYIAKKFLKTNPALAVVLFGATPVWIVLSNYFKYDINLIFWILLTMVFCFKFIERSTLRNFFITSFLCGIAVSVKVSAIPLYLLMIFSLVYLKKNKVRGFLLGTLIFTTTVFVFGIPDLLLGKGNITEFIYSNLVSTPGLISNFDLNQYWFFYLISRILPLDLGYPFFVIFMSSFVYFLFTKKTKEQIVLLVGFILFFVSILPLKLFAGGNRILVILPFLILLSTTFLEKMKFKWKNVAITIFIFIQFVQVGFIISYKFGPDIRQISSDWIVANIPGRSVIGLENIPIYQFLPDVVLKDYYISTQNIDHLYNYQIINVRDSLPNYIILTNIELNTKYQKKTEEKDILTRLKQQNYNEIYQLKPNPLLYIVMSNEKDMFFSGLVQEAPITIFIR